MPDPSAECKNDTDSLALLESDTTYISKITADASLEKQSLDSRAESGPITFFTLPPEIRNMIYKLNLVVSNKIHVRCWVLPWPLPAIHLRPQRHEAQNTDNGVNQPQLGIMLSCKMGFWEGAPILYSSNTFRFDCSWDLLEFLERIGNNRVHLQLVKFDSAILPQSAVPTDECMKGAALLATATNISSVLIEDIENRFHWSSQNYIVPLMNFSGPLLFTMYRRRKDPENIIRVFKIPIDDDTWTCVCGDCSPGTVCQWRQECANRVAARYEGLELAVNERLHRITASGTMVQGEKLIVSRETEIG